MGRIKKKRCRNCKCLFIPDPRNHKSQEYCNNPKCRKASKAASQAKWLNNPENKDYFRCAANVKRVQDWRSLNPGYSKRAKKPQSLQETLTVQATENKEDIGNIANNALQDLLMAQSPVIIGLIANITGSTLQDDIASTLLRMRKYGQDILSLHPQTKGDGNDCEIPSIKKPNQKGAQELQLDRSSPGAGALY